jgi:hypothetical protein
VGNLYDDPLAGLAIRLVGGQLVPNDGFAYVNYYDFDPTNKLDNKGVSLQADFNFDNDLLLTSITAYRKLSREDNVDVDFTSAKLVGENSGDTDIKTFTQELRLSQSLDNLDWMLGAYYFDESVDYDNVVTYDSAMNPYGNILSQGAINDIQQLLEATGQLPPGVGFLQAGQGALDFNRMTRPPRYSGKWIGILLISGP